MAMTDEELTEETVCTELATAIEALGQDGGSEIGEFAIGADESDPKSLIIYVEHHGHFRVTVTRI